MGVFEFVIYQFRNRCFYFSSKQTNSKNYVKYLTTVRKSIKIFELFFSKCFHFKAFKANVSPVYQIQISMSLVLAYRSKYTLWAKSNVWQIFFPSVTVTDYNTLNNY